MKKFLLFAVVLMWAQFSYAERDYIIDSNIQVSSVPVNNGPAATITLAAPGAGKSNCLTYVVFQSTSANQIYRILNGSTTNYQLTGIAANTAVRESWNPDAPLCADVNTAMQIKASVGGNGTELNYKGFIRR